MTTATLTAALPRFGFLKTLASAFSNAKRYERLFEMSDAQLKTQGLDRDMLVRSYVSGLANN